MFFYINKNYRQAQKWIVSVKCVYISGFYEIMLRKPLLLRRVAKILENFLFMKRFA